MYFMSTLLLSIFFLLCLPSSSVSFSYFVLAVSKCKCCGQYSCMSSSFPIVHAAWYLFFRVTRCPYFGRILARQKLTIIIIIIMFVDVRNVFANNKYRFLIILLKCIFLQFEKKVKSLKNV